jgi:phosphopantetheinyl transferase
VTHAAGASASSTLLQSVTSTGVHWRMGEPHGLATITAERGHAPPSAAALSSRLRCTRSTARSWVRDLVTSCLGLDWAGFEETPVGRKPGLRDLPGVDVSISHSGRMLLVAVVRGGRLGVDIEDEPFDVFGRPSLVRRMCAAPERDRFASLSGPSRSRTLARVWTVKEAALKAMGVGLAVDPRRIVVPQTLSSAWGTGPERSIVHLTTRSAHVFRPGGRRDDEAPSVWRGLHADWSG